LKSSTASSLQTIYSQFLLLLIPQPSPKAMSHSRIDKKQAQIRLQAQMRNQFFCKIASVEAHQGTNINNIMNQIRRSSTYRAATTSPLLLPIAVESVEKSFVVFCQKSSGTGFVDDDGRDVDVNETGCMHSVVRSTSASSGPCMPLLQQQQEARAYPISLLLLLLPQRFFFSFFFFAPSFWLTFSERGNSSSQRAMYSECRSDARGTELWRI
jgi:hypothetical protein